MRKLKRPDGWVIEEYITASGHLFEDGRLQLHDNDPDGEYTGRFHFKFTHVGKIDKLTPWYTEKTAPKWLLAMYREAIGKRTD